MKRANIGPFFGIRVADKALGPACVVLRQLRKTHLSIARTRPEKIEAFFGQLAEMDAEFMAILEVCGFNDWLIEDLRKWKCREIVLIHPEKPSKKKTDRRDAQKLADLLWLNRQRLAAGQIVRGLRRVYMVSQDESESTQKGGIAYEQKYQLMPHRNTDFQRTQGSIARNRRGWRNLTRHVVPIGRLAWFRSKGDDI